MRLFFIALPTLLVAGSVCAQTAKFADPEKSTALPVSGVSSLGQVTVALVIVLAVLFAAAWAMRQFKLFNRPGQGALEVVQGINLGPKERAVLIKVNGRPLLLGVAPGCVNLLLELPADGDARADKGLTDPAPTSYPDTPNFKALLKRSMGLS
jgi:flagellar biosynthetic protein FliO